MKTAFSFWEHRIAPVFDTARQIYLLESDGTQVSSETTHLISDESVAQRVAWLTAHQVHTLVCGAISRPLQMELVTADIIVIPFIAGDLHQVIQASLNGTLADITFRMPGCCGGWGLRRRDGCGRGEGRGRGNGRRCGGKNIL